jgi:hypothetical protein
MINHPKSRFSPVFPLARLLRPYAQGIFTASDSSRAKQKPPTLKRLAAYQRVLGCPSTRQDHCHHATRKPAKFANLQRVPFASMCHPPPPNCSMARMP